MLFDRLGWPWEVHICWELHRAQSERTPVLSAVEEEIADLGFNGRFYQPQGEVVEGPTGKEIRVTVSGYIADNHAGYEDPDTVEFRAWDDASTTEWVTVEIKGDQDGIFPFLMPRPVAETVKDYSLLRITGRWMQRDGAWHLITTSYSTRRYPDGKQVRRKVTQLDDPLACHFCGRKIRTSTSWGFDASAHLECQACSKARSSMSTRQFLGLCRIIVKRHLR